MRHQLLLANRPQRLTTLSTLCQSIALLAISAPQVSKQHALETTRIKSDKILVKHAPLGSNALPRRLSDAATTTIVLQLKWNLPSVPLDTTQSSSMLLLTLNVSFVLQVITALAQTTQQTLTVTNQSLFFL